MGTREKKYFEQKMIYDHQQSSKQLEPLQQQGAAEKPEVSSEKTRDELLAEVEQLRFELAVTKATLDVLKKDQGVDCSALTNSEKVQIIDAVKRSGFSLTRLLKRFVLSKSSYFYVKSSRDAEDKYAELRVRVKEIFEASAMTYGSERIWAALRRGDATHAPLCVSEKVIRRIMREEGLRVIYVKKKRHYNSYQGEIQERRPDNLVKRDFHADKPNKLWLTDITQFNLRGNKCYLSPIIDCFDGMVVSYTLSKNPDESCVLSMLKEAVTTLKEGEHPVLHSDGGIQYWWSSWQNSCDEAGIKRSMSKKASSPDNSACEGFFGRLKNELFYYRDTDNLSYEEFQAQLEGYIRWYNEERIKKSLGWMSPVEYRMSCALAA